MNLLKLALFQMYLLQLENYKLKRYWKTFVRVVFAGSFGSPQRQKLVWTIKARIIFILSLTLALLPALAANNIWLIAILWLVFANAFAPIFLSVATIIVSPLDYLAKQFIIRRAKHRLKNFLNLKIIGITGSFGKTTMKERLSTILSEKFKVLKTPENINTPIGIGRLILSQLDKSVEVLIVEMGAYEQGDIRDLCRITPPDIAVLTGINQAHLERFGNIANTIETKFEIVKFAKPSALLVLNEDNELVRDNYSKYSKDRKIFWYKNSLEYPFGIKPVILGSYISGILSGCAAIAKELGLAEDQIKEGIKKIKPIPHRLEQIQTSNGVTVIDDSYNSNPDGAKEAIDVLNTFKHQRKVYVTPGLVEMGEQTQEVHQVIGEHLATVADKVILIRNSVTPFIADGLLSKGFNQDNIHWFNSSLEAHNRIPKIIKPGDVVMFQNDWPDNYV